MLYIAFLLITAIEMLCEVYLSHRNSAVLVDRGAIEIAPRILPVMTVLYVVMYAGSWAEYALSPKHISVLWATGFGFLFIAAKALKFWAIKSLGALWTMRVLIVPGTRVITSGPYRWIKHPNYVAVLMEIAGTTLLGKCYVTGASVLSLFFVVVYYRIRVEEHALSELTEYPVAMRRYMVAGLLCSD